MILIEAATRVFKYVLFDHIRARDPGNASRAARKWIENVIDQMNVDGFEVCEDSTKIPLKQKRGRPKRIPPKILDFNEEKKVQTRSQKSKGIGIMDDITFIFKAPQLTVSPKKIRKKVAISLSLSNLSAKDLDQFRTTT